MTLTLLPNVEALVSAFLRAQAEMTALVAARVYTVLPKAVEFPCVRITQFNDFKVTERPLWVVSASLQVDCWGGSKIDAWRTAATAQALMNERMLGQHAEGVVSNVRIGGTTDIPDVDFEPARPRFFFTANITAHP